VTRGLVSTRRLMHLTVKRLFPSAAMQLAASSLVVWPFVGALNLLGKLLAEQMMGGVPDVAVAQLIGPFLAWAALAPVIAATAVVWRPGASKAPRVAMANGIMFLACSVLQWSLWQPDAVKWTYDGAVIARHLIFGAWVYMTITCTTWTHLLLRDVVDATAFERRAIGATSAATVNRLALPARYFATLLRRIDADLRNSAATAEESTVAIAQLLRMQLDASRNGTWPLVSELELLDRYLDLERTGGREWRVIVSAGTDAGEQHVWPGSLAAEVSSLLTESSLQGGVVTLTVDDDSGTLRVEVVTGTARHSLRIEPPPIGDMDIPQTRLAALARTLSRNGRSITVVVIVALWALGTMTSILFRPSWNATVLAHAGLRTASRIALVAPSIFALAPRRSSSPLHIFAITFGAAVAGEWWYQIFIGRAYGNPWYAVFIVSAAVTISSISLVYLSIAAIAAILHMVRVARVASESNERALEVTRRLRESQARFLLWQTNPHFLFNALNSMAALVRSDREAAERFLSSLQSFYERMTDIEAETHTVDAEQRLLAGYFAIEKVRFGDAVSFHLAVENGLGEAQVPALFLQPLVENATKHGTLDGGVLRVGISVRSAGGRLIVTVTNPAASPPGAFSEGTGLRITRDRLLAMYGTNAAIETRVHDGAFMATVVIPLQFVRPGQVESRVTGATVESPEPPTTNYLSSRA
jgi:hypothetical protein